MGSCNVAGNLDDQRSAPTAHELPNRPLKSCSILISGFGSVPLNEFSEALSDPLQGAELQLSSGISETYQTLQQSVVDLLVLETEGAIGEVLNLLHWLKLQDSEPAVLVVGEANLNEITQLYSSGCQRFIGRGPDWLQDLAQSARSALRIRRLQAENQTLLSRLTEANRLLEEKNRRLDEFSATLAHDIRGPLAGVGMKLEYVLDKYGAQFPERAITLLNSSLQATTRLISLVQTMYDFAKLGARAARMHTLQLSTLIKEVIGDLHVNEARQIEIGIGELPAVWGAEDLIRRVFLNLISNAVKYNDKEVVIINIGTGNTRITPLATFVEIFVEDNGPGISAEEQESIFGFFNRSKQHTHSTDGLGVGLGVVQRIAELHFGNVELTSTPETGARFSIWLPVEEIKVTGI